MDFNEDSKSLTKWDKHIFQEKWDGKIKWDDLLPRDLAQRGLQWKRELRLLKSFTVPRCSAVLYVRVRPLKENTIPRMELETTLLCALLIEHFYPITPIKISRVRAWTDSAVVFHWIQSEASNWKIYVANWAQIIQDILGPSFWSHVSGVHHPADHGCRGLSAAQFCKNRFMALWTSLA
ncbi:unnamed protein product [Lepeophtheirus salmonis]|uniref:(salmon louse) hypothetical protein n=1 Tax=Lepeophtheirus salmonis TaxID=72036 RepID=A0A7R8CB50_LEPSM|nr:unnamed protein product [Lepeophtheirus salmonis]CAF2750033.1 unnamed protein product [Lepeophtheirus salmonis]